MLRGSTNIWISILLRFSSFNSKPLLINHLLYHSTTITPTFSKLLHQRYIVNGHILNYTYITNLIANYISSNSTTNAILLLESLTPSHSSVLWWNQLIRHALHHNSPYIALTLFRRMKTLNWTPDNYTFPFVFKACGEISYFNLGCSIHAIVLRLGFDSNVFVCNIVVSMYGKCNALVNARKVIDKLCHRGICDLVSWNSIVSTYSHCFVPKVAFLLFREMTVRHGLLPDVVGVVNILVVCGFLGLGLLGKHVHGFGVRIGLVDDVFVGNALVDMYAKCGKMVDAYKVFERMGFKDVVTWNVVIVSFV